MPQNYETTPERLLEILLYVWLIAVPRFTSSMMQARLAIAVLRQAVSDLESPEPYYSAVRQDSLLAAGT